MLLGVLSSTSVMVILGQAIICTKQVITTQKTVKATRVLASRLIFFISLISLQFAVANR